MAASPEANNFEQKILDDLKECKIAAINLSARGDKNGDYYNGRRSVLEWLAKEIELDISQIDDYGAR